MGVTSQDIEQCCREGAGSVGELMARTGAGTGCGCCKGWIEEHLAETQGKVAFLPVTVTA
jgi:assimilatory nitrate reductase electron transfer subunit